MPKKDFSITIENHNQINHIDVKAILTEEEIKYKETDGTITHFNYKNKILTRENKNLKMTYRFLENRKTEGTIEIKELNQEMKVTITTKKLKEKEKNMEISFLVEEDPFI
ncbi:MAG: hypothetical protein IKE70_00010, partial [Bacilli bacterium]|nr:hypothetical protein [Bacilli bacterium]